jgi:hypothetical protein
MMILLLPSTENLHDDHSFVLPPRDVLYFASTADLPPTSRMKEVLQQITK